MLLIAFRFPWCNFSGVRIAVGRAGSAGSLAHGLWARYWLSGVLWVSQRSMGIAGGGQKGGRIESRAGGGTRGKSQWDKHAPCSLRVGGASSLGTRDCCGLGSWAAQPGLGGSSVCIMALWAQAVMWPYTGVTSSVSIRLLSPSLFLWLVIEKRMSSPPRSGKWEPQEETSWKVYMGRKKNID